MTENPTLLQYGRAGRKHALINYRWKGDVALMNGPYKSVLESQGGKR
jgi:hypothetical protein